MVHHAYAHLTARVATVETSGGAMGRLLQSAPSAASGTRIFTNWPLIRRVR